MIEAGRRLRIGALLVLVAVVIAAAVTFLGEPPVDDLAVEEARSLRDGWFGQLMQWLTDVGYALWLVPAAGAIAIVYGVALRRWRDALVVGLATPVASVVTRLLKESFERARPEDGVDLLIAGFSMPSGHSTSSAAFATSLVLATWPSRARTVVIALAVSFALLVGVSRVVQGAHYPSDVIAGFCSGTGVALIVAGTIGHMRRRVTASTSV